MKSEITDVSPTQKELKIEIDAALLKDAYGKVSQKYAKRANVPGFRKGYAPVDVVRLRFREEIKSEVLQEVVPAVVSDAIREHDLHPLSEPHMHLDDQDKIKVNGSQAISLHVRVEVMPEIAVPEYEGMEVTRRVKLVEDSAVDELIAQRLQKEAALIPVEGRKSEVGDTVIADLEGTFDDDPGGEPVKAHDLEIVLGDAVIEKSFTENLVGVNEDEEKEFTIVYPGEFSSEALAGKTLHYKAKIKSVGKTEIPEPNDTWAKSLDEGYDSIADLRNKLKVDLEKYEEEAADARVRNSAIVKLIYGNPFEVPNTLIENQARNLLNNFAEDMQRRGVDINKVEKQFLQMAYNNMRQQAERDVRGAILLDRVAGIENIDVTDAEVDDEIEKMAGYYKASTDEIRESLVKQGGGVENIRNNLKTRKSIEAIVAKSIVTEGEWVAENDEEPEPAEKLKKSAKKSEPAMKAAKKAGPKSI